MDDRPSALIIGAGKAGTTSLHRYIGSHPEAVASKTKEIMYFSSKYDQGSDWYRSFFPIRQGAKVYFESTPQYSFRDEFPDVARRVHSFNPGMKIIYIAREPISRIVSHFNHWSRVYPKQYINIEVALKRPEQRKYFVERTRYFYQISAFLELFPLAQIKLVFLEDLISDFSRTLDDVFGFLGIAPAANLIKPNAHNKRPEEGGRHWTSDDISDSRKQEICSYLGPDVQEFLKLGNKNPDFWGAQYL